MKKKHKGKETGNWGLRYAMGSNSTWTCHNNSLPNCAQCMQPLSVCFVSKCRKCCRAAAASGVALSCLFLATKWQLANLQQHLEKSCVTSSNLPSPLVTPSLTQCGIPLDELPRWKLNCDLVLKLLEKIYGKFVEKENSLIMKVKFESCVNVLTISCKFVMKLPINRQTYIVHSLCACVCL